MIAWRWQEPAEAVVSLLVYLVLGAARVPNRIARAHYRWVLFGRDGDATAVAPEERDRPVRALRYLRLWEDLASVVVYLLVLTGAVALWPR